MLEHSKEIRQPTKFELSMAETVKNDAVKKADKIVKEYMPTQFFEGPNGHWPTEITTPLFIFNLAKYLIQQEGAERSYLNRHPATEIGKRMKLIGWLFRSLDFLERVDQHALAHLEAQIDIIQTDLEQTKPTSSPTHKFKLAANMISAFYLEHEKNPEELKEKIENYLRRHFPYSYRSQ